MPKFTGERANPAFSQETMHKKAVLERIAPARKKLREIIKARRKELLLQELPLKVSEQLENSRLQMNATLRHCVEDLRKDTRPEWNSIPSSIQGESFQIEKLRISDLLCFILWGKCKKSTRGVRGARRCKRRNDPAFARL
jgi:hypothetical protein